MLKDFLPWSDRAGAGAGPGLQVGAASAPAVSPNQATGHQLLFLGRQLRLSFTVCLSSHPDRDEKPASALEEALAPWVAGPLNSQLQCKVTRALDGFA